MSAPYPVRVLPLHAANAVPTDFLVRTHATPLLEGWVFGFGIAGAIGATTYVGGMPWLAGTVLGGLLAAGGASALAKWRRVRRPDAWLLALGHRRMLVQLRAPLDGRPLSTVPREVVELPYGAIACVRLLSRQFQRHRKNRKHGLHVYLEIRTRGVDLHPLRHALARESPAPGPVWLDEDDVIRVHLAGALSTRPASADVLRLLGDYVLVQDAAEELVAVSGARRLEPTGQAATLRALVEAGEADEAVQLARALYGEDLPHARARIRRLQAPPAPPTIPPPAHLTRP